MARYPKPAEGSWTQHYPQLGTKPVSYEDSISPEFFELEREAIFKRAWLHVGRVEQIPRTGNFFTKEIAAAQTSIIIVRGDGRRDPRVPQHLPAPRQPPGLERLTPGGGERDHPAVQLQVPRLALRARRRLRFAQQEGEFFDLDKADYGLVSVHCETFAGFIFVNLSREPTQSLRDYLGPMILGIEGYPFDKMTDQYTFQVEVGANWKVFSDAFMEFYHAPIVHGGQHTPRSRRRCARTATRPPTTSSTGRTGW